MQKEVRDGRINLNETLGNFEDNNNKMWRQRPGLKGGKKVVGILKGDKHLFSPAKVGLIDARGQKGDKRFKPFQLPELTNDDNEELNKTVQGFKGARMTAKKFGKGGGFIMNKTAQNHKLVEA